MERPQAWRPQTACLAQDPQPLPGRRLQSNLPSIRIGQAGYSPHFRWSRSSALAKTISFRMTAVIANFLHLPIDTSCSYLTFKSGLKRVATTAGK